MIILPGLQFYLPPIAISFYPQGSFATRTVVRPYEKGEERLYDVDVICEVNNLPENALPEKLMDIFENALESSRYSEKYIRWDKCFTVEYAEKDEDEFSIDIIPSLPASIERIYEIKKETERSELVDSSIDIPDVNENNSTWISNNPTGYTTWFNRQTQKFEQRFIDYNDGVLTASIEELPEDSPTNMMRNVIKILKRLRDVYFFRSKSENRPASIVITTIVAKLANRITFVDNDYDLLKTVISELKQLERFTETSDFSTIYNEGYVVSEIISYENRQWILKNPANGLDNILSSWNEERNIAEEFFKWIDVLNRMVNNFESSSMSIAAVFYQQCGSFYHLLRPTLPVLAVKFTNLCELSSF